MGSDMDILLRVLAIVTPVLSGICVYLLKDIRAEQKAMREDMERYVRTETCRAHREAIQQQLDTLRDMNRQ